jgi:hypothetical protein
MAESVYRAVDRYDSPRMPGSSHRLQRAQPVPAPARIPGLLSSEPHPPVVGERQSRATTDPTAGVGSDRLRWWENSIIVTSGARVDRAILMIISGDECRQTGDHAPGYHRRAETRLAFGMQLSLPNRSAPNPNVRNWQMSPLNAGRHGLREPQYGVHGRTESLSAGLEVAAGR